MPIPIHFLFGQTRTKRSEEMELAGNINGHVNATYFLIYGNNDLQIAVTHHTANSSDKANLRVLQ